VCGLGLASFFFSVNFNCISVSFQMIFDLPFYLTLEILSKWLCDIDIVKLDSGLTNQVNRKMFLDILSSSLFVLHCTKQTTHHYNDNQLYKRNTITSFQRRSLKRLRLSQNISVWLGFRKIINFSQLAVINCKFDRLFVSTANLITLTTLIIENEKIIGYPIKPTTAKSAAITLINRCLNLRNLTVKNICFSLETVEKINYSIMAHLHSLTIQLSTRKTADDSAINHINQHCRSLVSLNIQTPHSSNSSEHIWVDFLSTRRLKLERLFFSCRLNTPAVVEQLKFCKNMLYLDIDLVLLYGEKTRLDLVSLILHNCCNLIESNVRMSHAGSTSHQTLSVQYLSKLSLLRVFGDCSPNDMCLFLACQHRQYKRIHLRYIESLDDTVINCATKNCNILVQFQLERCGTLYSRLAITNLITKCATINLLILGHCHDNIFAFSGNCVITKCNGIACEVNVICFKHNQSNLSIRKYKLSQMMNISEVDQQYLRKRIRWCDDSEKQVQLTSIHWTTESSYTLPNKEKDVTQLCELWCV
jgi:hypothetical protein